MHPGPPALGWVLTCTGHRATSPPVATFPSETGVQKAPSLHPGSFFFHSKNAEKEAGGNCTYMPHVFFGVYDTVHNLKNVDRGKDESHGIVIRDLSRQLSHFPPRGAAFWGGLAWAQSSCSSLAVSLWNKGAQLDDC